MRHRHTKHLPVYHESLGSALNAAFEHAEDQGYTVLDTDQFYEPVHYEMTRRYMFGLEKNGKPVNKVLVASVYRLRSGRYELTAYVG